MPPRPSSLEPKSRYHEAAKSTKGKGPGKAVTMRQPKEEFSQLFASLEGPKTKSGMNAKKKKDSILVSAKI